MQVGAKKQKVTYHIIDQSITRSSTSVTSPYRGDLADHQRGTCTLRGYARAPSSLLFLRSARYPQMPRFLQFLREFWPMPLPLMIHSALALFAQRTRIPTSARSIGFCVIWVCISSSSTGEIGFYRILPGSEDM